MIVKHTPVCIPLSDRKHPHPAQREKKSRLAQKPGKEALRTLVFEASRSKKTRVRRLESFFLFQYAWTKKMARDAFWTRVSWPRNRADLTTVSCVTHFLVPPKTLVFFAFRILTRILFHQDPTREEEKDFNTVNKCMGNWFFLSSSWMIVSPCRTLVTDYIYWVIHLV